MTPSALARFGEPGIKLAEALRKQQADQVEQEIKVLDYATRRLAAANPQTYPAIRADLARINPQFAAGLPEQFDAEQVMSLARQGLSLKEQIESATRETVVAPGATLVRGGKPIYTAPVAPVKPTPAETEELVARLQDPTLTPAARKRLEARLDILTTREPKEPREPKDDPHTVVAFRETDAAGNVTLLNKFGQVITPSAPVKGKPSATFEKTTAQRKQLGIDLDRAIMELKDVSKDKGLIDQSTGSGFGRGIDISAGFFGQATPGAIAIGKLAPIADLVLKMVPRFEGPQSDKDTKSYKEAAGQLADATLPTDIRKAAAKQIVRLMEARKGQFVTQEMAAEGVGAAPRAPTTGVDTSNPLLK